MTKQAKEYLITGVGLIVLIFMLMGRLGKGKKTAPKGDTAKKTQPAAAASAVPVTDRASRQSKDIEELLALQAAHARKDWGRDPFFFEVTKKVYKGRKMLLRGVSVGRDSTKYAYINDSIVTVGESIEGYTVLDIEKDRVLLRRGVDSFYLGISEE